MSNDLPAWKYITENATAIPKDPSVQDGYVLLLVLVSVFIGGTLVLLSGILIICRRCCETDRRYSRANDDPEKTNTTYLEESQPTQEITIKVDDSECLSTGSYHDLEAERFLSTGSTGRRVSFNEASLFDHGKKTQEKGRRYTLTEGDFHHLKNARLTHLHISPPSLKIVTIHECESSENNSLAMTTQAPSSSKTNLSIFQSIINPLPQTALTSHSVNPSSALPGDTFNSSVNTTFVDANVPTPADSGESSVTEGLAGSTKGSSSSSSNAIEAVTAPNQGPVLQFFTKLRRNASLESASPYFKIKKWKFETSQRALSLDTRGSPKRHQFHRQRAASESMEHEDQDPHQTDIIQYIAHTDDVTFGTPSTPFAQPPSSPPPSASRLDAAENLPNGSESTERRESSDQQRICRDIWNLRASLELYISSEQSSNDKESERSDAESVCSVGGLLTTFSQDTADEADDLEEVTGSKRLKQDSVGSERVSDSETNTRKLLQMDSGYASIEAPSRALEERIPRGDSERGTQDTTASEKRRFFTSSGRKGTVFESYDAKPLSEEFEEEGAVGGEPIDWSPYGQMFVTRDYLHRRDYSIDEKSDALFNAFLRHDPQFDDSPLKSKHRSRIHLRKQWQRTKQYSDPGIRYPPALERHRNPLRRGDSVNYPLDHRYQSTLPRIISATDEEPSESGQEHVKSPTSKHSEAEPSGSETAGVDAEARIQIIEEETAEQGNATDQTEQPDQTDFPQSLGQISGFTETNRPTDFAYGPQMIGADPIDKLTTSIEDRLYTSLKKSKESVDCVVVTVTHASPDHSPV